MSIKEKYNIPNDGKVLLYVGNISVNKNQRQMVEVFGLLPETLRDNTWVLFCGRPSVDGSFERMVEESSYNRHLVLCGCIDRNEMPDYYNEADGVVLLSYAEGFGLSLIEGMHYGVPCAMPVDLDAFEDIFNEQAVVKIDDRDNLVVSKQITELLSKTLIWETIKYYATRFNSESMAIKYKEVYKTPF